MEKYCGSLQTRSWDDAQGVKHYATEVVADEVNFCGDNRNGAATQNNDGQGFTAAQNNVVNTGFTPVDTDDDLPF